MENVYNGYCCDYMIWYLLLIFEWLVVNWVDLLYEEEFVWCEMLMLVVVLIVLCVMVEMMGKDDVFVVICYEVV